MANAEQVEHWGGPGGEHWVAEQERYDRMLEPFGDEVVRALAPNPGERVLDVGCGNGALSLALARAIGPDGEVVGADISGPMLTLAGRRAREEGLGNVRFERADAQVHRFGEASFDAVVSRFGVMFFDDPPAAFVNLARALRPGGRLVFVCWQDLFQNEWIMVPATAALAHVPMPAMGQPGQPGPFALADAGRVTSLLEGAGFTDVGLTDVRASTPMGRSVDDVMRFLEGAEFARALMADVSEEVSERAWAAVREALEGRAGPEGVVLGGAAWLVTAGR